MNRKAQSEILNDNVIFLIILIVFFGAMLYFALNQASGGAIWADFYSKEIVRQINFARPGDAISLDIQKATEIAQAKGQTTFSSIFEFNNAENEVCVSLSPNRKTCFSYFNQVDIINPKIKLGLGSPYKNTLTFEIKEKPK
jgi:hypothetical protein